MVNICNILNGSNFKEIFEIKDIKRTINYFNFNKPSEFLHNEFFEHPLFKKNDCDGYSSWWKDSDSFKRDETIEEIEESKNERILFLQHLIKQIENEE